MILVIVLVFYRDCNVARIAHGSLIPVVPGCMEFIGSCSFRDEATKEEEEVRREIPEGWWGAGRHQARFG